MGMTVDEALSKKRRVGKWVITHNGEEKTLYEWADHLGVNPKRIQSRLAKGMEFSSIVSFLNKSEKSMSFTEFCNLAGVSHTTAKSRLKSGMSLMEAITAPVNNKRISRRAA
jgi:DNA-directed RNA polymerase specialized sigma24 family protein